MSGCSVRNYALDQAADALANQGTGFASDDDPELIRDAAPFSLKLIDSLIAQRPRHGALLLAATRAYTQYAYAFVQQDADRLEDSNVAEAYRLRQRAAGFYRRARDYGLKALGNDDPEYINQLRTKPGNRLDHLGAESVPLLYWTGAAWAGWIALSKDNGDAIADWPVVQALLDRASTLDAAYGNGALQGLLINVEMARGGDPAKATAQARSRFDRAVQWSGGKLAAPYVTLAEAVAVPNQDRAEFNRLLASALAIDPDGLPEARLENRIMQNRGRWLQAHADKFFME